MPTTHRDSNDGRRRGPLTFTIQKHAARRLHYDMRLEIDGVLVSWPIPLGPSYNPAVRRLAIQTEDHLYEHGTFEGPIPAGEYGGRGVIVWDAGTYTIVEREEELPDLRDRQRAEQRARTGVERGRMRVFFNGRKLKGGWTLTRTHGEGVRSQWLFIKRHDGLEDPSRDVTSEDRSIFSGLTLEDMRAGMPPRENKPRSLRPTARGIAGARRSAFPRPPEPAADDARPLAFVRHGDVQLHSGGADVQHDRMLRALRMQPVDSAVFDVIPTPDGYTILDMHYLDGFDLRKVHPRDRQDLLHAVLAPVGGLHEVAHSD
jgi:DNA ligase D-like protein (predicted 3'-phosphoesterase)